MGGCRASLFNPQSLIKAHLLVAGRSASEWTPPQNVGRKLVQGAVVVVVAVETSLRIESLYLAISAGREEFLAISCESRSRSHLGDVTASIGLIVCSNGVNPKLALHAPRVCYSISYI